MTDATDAATGTPKRKGGMLFHIIAMQPFAFCVLLPIVFGIFVAVGFTRDDIVEDSVGEIWIPTSDQLAKNLDYMKNLGIEDFTSTSFAAMAFSRDGGNLFNEERLEEIRERMDAIEDLSITYNNEEFFYEDICARSGLGAGTGTTYRFPCARLSPMDLFQETRTYFKEIDRVTWYHGVVKGAAIRPRVLRFGILQQECLGMQEGQSDACKVQAGLRMNADFAEQMGYPREYANPLGLIGDVGSLELSDDCRICIEDSLEAKMEQLQNELIVPFFTVLTMELRRFQQTLTDPEEQAQVDVLATNAEKIAQNVDRKSVEDFFYYQVLRGTYAELGAEAYQAAYNQLITPANVPFDCEAMPCPKFNITLDDAKQDLLHHADNTFSSVTTAGSPLPAWSKSDGTGTMLAGFEAVGGSGIDMSANTFSIVAYFDLQNYGKPDGWTPLYANNYADPLNDTNWDSLVEKNPIYAWFMSAEEEMTAHCGNGDLTGSDTGDLNTDTFTQVVATQHLTSYWCTKYNQPFEVDGTETKQHFARMWYDLLLDSDSFLGITQGEDDPYTWTLGAGCGYTLTGERYPYTGQSESDILVNASRELYFIDEGASVGVIDRNLLVGDVSPAVGKYNYSNPLQEVGVIQSLFAGLGEPKAIVQRVQNCNRPGGPTNITVEDAEEILKQFKEEFDNVWSKGWDDDQHGEVAFVSFSDDVGAVGTTGRFLKEITMSNGQLTVISIVIICAFSVFLMASLDAVESKVGLTLVGCGLVVLSYFAALGFSIMIGIKVNVATAWTLPFILLGLGVDDMYIVLFSLKKEKGYSEHSFLRGMREVVVPVTMTSLVNASMFGIMNISDVPAVYLTARVALIAVCFLYLSIIFCFSAYCFLDMRRQESGRRDLVCCTKAQATDGEEGNKCVGTWLSGLLYGKLFRPLILGSSPIRMIFHAFLWAIGIGLLSVAIWGIATQREVGLGLEDFFPSDHQAQTWASMRTENLGSWSIGINWGALPYAEPDTQLKMIKQFEDIVDHPHIAEVDTKQLWIAGLAIWTSRMCDAGVARPTDTKNCGRDQIWPVDNSTCGGTWKRNTIGLRQKNFADPSGQCNPYEGGICRPTSEMHVADLVDLGIDPENMSDEDANEVWCPVFEGWSNDKLGFCVMQWRFLTGGGGKLLLDDTHGTPTQCSGEYYSNEEVTTPIPYSSGPTMFTFNLLSHDITTDVIEETRAICDYDKEVHCWMTGIPYDYWSQYVGIFDTLLEISGSSVAVGFVVAVLFLFAQLSNEGNHGLEKIVGGSLVGSLLITAVTVASLVSVIGLSIVAGVSVTGFSIMSFVLSVGFSVEYAVHVVSRWLHAPLSISSAPDRVHYAMEFLTLPTFMSFISSTIGVCALGFTEFSFTQVFYFRPLIIVMPVTYFFGCWWLPAFLCLLDFDFLKLGEESEEEEELDTEEKTPAATAAAVPLPEPTDMDKKMEDSHSDPHSDWEETIDC